MPINDSIQWNRVRPDPPAVDRDEREVLHNAIKRAGDSRCAILQAAADHGHEILIVTNDPHRNTRTAQALNALADFIAAEKESPPRIAVLVATGTHEFSDRDRRDFERRTFDQCTLPIGRIEWHHARAAPFPVVDGFRFNRTLFDARFILAIGSVEPHYFAGLTGPHKTITVGCMSYGDVEANHRHALHPSADVLALRGNPVFDGIAVALNALESHGARIVSIGQVVCGDRVVAASVGHPLEIIDDLLPAVRRSFIYPLNSPVDVLHLMVPPPLGATLYQADKAIKNNQRAVRDGGAIILEAECANGVGPDHFLHALRESADAASLRAMIDRRGYRLGDHKALKLRELTDPQGRHVHIALVSQGVSDADAQSAGMKRLANVASAKEWIVKSVDGSIGRGLVVEDAGNMCCAIDVRRKS